VLALGVEELGVHLGDTAERERVDADEVLGLDLTLLAAEDSGGRVELLQALLNVVELYVLDKVGLVEKDAVSESNLLLGLVLDSLGLLVVKPRCDVLGVDNSDDSVKDELGLDLLIDEEGLGDRSGVGKAGCLDDDGVELLNLLVELLKSNDKVSTDGAADASVHNLDDLLVGILTEDFLVDTDIAELVLNDRKTESVVLVVENVVKEGGLSGTEETGEDGYWDACIL